MGSQSEAWLSISTIQLSMFIVCSIHDSLNGDTWKNASRNTMRSKTEVILKVTSLLKTYVL